jgi:hypothetical protein
MTKQEQQVIAIRAFFLNSGLLYRTFLILDEITKDEIEVLLGRARGKADITKRAYAISKSVSRKLSEKISEKIEWNFDNFFYQVGVFEKTSEIQPDGFLLTCRSKVDGRKMHQFAARKAFCVSALTQLASKKELSEYDNIYLGSTLPDEAFALFTGLEKSNMEEFFFELTPILRAHEEFYEKNMGLMFNSYVKA